MKIENELPRELLDKSMWTLRDRWPEGMEARIQQHKRHREGLAVEGPEVECFAELAEPMNRLFVGQLAVGKTLVEDDDTFHPWSEVDAQAVVDVKTVIEKWSRQESEFGRWLVGLGKLMGVVNEEDLRNGLAELQEASWEIYKKGGLTPLFFAHDYASDETGNREKLRIGEVELYLLKPRNDLLNNFVGMEQEVMTRKAVDLDSDLMRFLGEYVDGAGWPALSIASGQSMDSRRGIVVLLNAVETVGPIEKLFDRLGFPIEVAWEMVVKLLYAHELAHVIAPDFGTASLDELAADLVAVVAVLEDVKERDRKAVLTMIAAVYAWQGNVEEEKAANDNAYRMSGRKIFGEMVRVGLVDKHGQINVDGGKVDVFKVNLENCRQEYWKLGEQAVQMPNGAWDDKTQLAADCFADFKPI